MLYLGHSSFEGRDVEGPIHGPRHGWFTCIVEADSIDPALERFRELLAGLKKEPDGFDSITKVYLDSCIEVKKVPTRGALTHFQEQHGEPTASIATSLPGVSEEFCESYGWAADDEEDVKTIEPFMTFDE